MLPPYSAEYDAQLAGSERGRMRKRDKLKTNEDKEILGDLPAREE